jgi:hypothetical protein
MRDVLLIVDVFNDFDTETTLGQGSAPVLSVPRRAVTAMR